MTAPVAPDDTRNDHAGTVAESSMRPNPRSAALIAVVSVVLLLIALVGYLGCQRWSWSTVEANRPEVVAVASGQAVAMLSYTPEDVEEQLRAAVEGMTESFGDEYLELLDTVIAPAARDAGTSTEIAVVGAAATEVERTSAEVLLFLNQTTTTAAEPEPEPTVSGSRVTVALEKVDGRWLVASLNPA